MSEPANAAHPHAATLKRLEQSSGRLAANAIARMDETLPWYRAMPPENRSWIGLVAQAGIAAFTEWFRHPETPQAISTDVFGTAPRELTHRDSAGHETLVRPGDVQRLSSAGGVRHVERNDGATPLTFVQMWLAPLDPGGDPSYEIVHGIADSTPYAVPEAGAMLHVRRLVAGERTAVPDAPYVYAQIVRGEVRLDGVELGPGDAVRVTDAKDLEAVGVTGAELLLWEMSG